ncbi:MAG: hypothetical protein ABI432_07585 [Flavobacteriales bacterium]
MCALPYPIRLAITGHRKDMVAHRDQLITAVQQALSVDHRENGKIHGPTVFDLFEKGSQRAIRRARTTSFSYTLLTGLAEGADRIVTDAVLALPHSRVVPVLPIEQADYEATFEGPGAVKDFGLQLERCARPVQLQGSSKDLTAAFRGLGEYLVANSDVLIAVLDSTRKGGDGGTADVVAMARRAGHPLLIIDEHFKVSVEMPGTKRLKCPGIAQFERLNKIVVGRELLEKSMNDLLGFGNGSVRADYPVRVDVLERSLVGVYARADLLAKQCKSWFLGVGIGVHVFSALAVLSVACGLVIPWFGHVAYLVEACILFVILCAVLWGQRMRVHRRWLQSRFLAERCRTMACGFVLGFEPTRIEPLALARKEEDDRWVVLAHDQVWSMLDRSVEVAKARAMNTEGDRDTAHDLVLNTLIAGQVDYHDGKQKRNERINHRLETSGHVVFALALVAALLHYFLPAGKMIYRPHALQDVLTVLAVLLPVVAASIEGVRKLGGYARMALSNQRMARELEGITGKLSDKHPLSELNATFRELDQVLNRESQEWLALMITNELEPVT